MPDIWKLMRAIRKSDLSAPERHTLLTLTSLVDPKTGLIPDRFQPSLTDLTRFTKLGRSTIVRSLNTAEDLGWIKRTVPNKKAAQVNKEKTAYLLQIPDGALDDDDEDPEGASPTVALVPQGDQSEGWCQGGPSATVGLGLVPGWDGASATVGHEVLNHVNQGEPPPPSEEGARGSNTADPEALFSMPGKSASATSTQTPKRRPRLSRVITKDNQPLPDDWAVSDEMTKWAKGSAPNVITRIATERFLTHFRDSGRKKDWDKTWRNWILGDEQRFQERNSNNANAAPVNRPYQGRRSSNQHVPYRDRPAEAYKNSKI